MGSVRFVTFGCKANQYDTQVLREALGRRGWREEEREADLVVVNTCTVTTDAGRKARKLIRRVVREHPDTKVCVTGCLAESEPEVLRELPGVEWVLGNGDARRPLNFLRQLGCDVDPEELGIPAGITAFAGHTRAFLKIQDGCDRSCAFCIIPRVRGANRSRPADELAAEVLRLVEAGHVEIVLCGIHIGHWGREWGGEPADLLAVLAAVEPRDERGAPLPFRLRLSSIEATEISPRLVELMARRPERIAPHLHMPLQSGDDEILAAMNRWYRMDEYHAACERIRAALDRPAFTADVLVGFPGEGERQFARTLQAVRQIGFSRVHVFPFSPRPRTAAWEMGPAVPPEEVRERRSRLGEVAAEVAQTWRRDLGGATDLVVVEGEGGLSGRYQRVRLDRRDFPATPAGLVAVRLEAHERDAGIELIGRADGSLGGAA
ncbi:MAG: MiaB/RimO family radical SAM methylthiotransferase [Planctomycetota bacterium]|nr:MiaB/RimO family radical SAM methylthiotransferase [Planctomycetota bacterium]